MSFFAVKTIGVYLWVKMTPLASITALPIVVKHCFLNSRHWHRLGWSCRRHQARVLRHRQPQAFPWLQVQSSGEHLDQQILLKADQKAFFLKSHAANRWRHSQWGPRSLPEVSCLRLWGWVLSMKLNWTESNNRSAELCFISVISSASMSWGAKQ